METCFESWKRIEPVSFFFAPDINEVDKLLVSDAQTSGGLLISMAPDEAYRFIENSNIEISIIGKIKRRKKSLIQLLR